MASLRKQFTQLVANRKNDTTSTHLKRQTKKYSKGETLMEVMISILIISLAALASSSIIAQSSRISLEVERRLMAKNLAREGIEVIAMIRNTNRIRFLNLNKCWDVSLNAEACPPAGFNKLEPVNPSADPANYSLIVQPYNLDQWALKKINNPLDLNNQNAPENDEYALFEIDNGPAKGILRGFDILPESEEDPLFYRMIQIERIANDNLIVTSAIEWKTGSKVNHIEMKESFTNY